MSEWKTYKLGEIIELKRGYDLPEYNRVHGKFPVFTSSGFSSWHNGFKVKGPGVVTGRYGTLGEVFYTEKDYWPHNTTLYVRDFKGNDAKFIFYFLKTLRLASGNDKSSVPGLNRNDLHNFNVTIPDLPTQRQIAAILSSLDDKIELNLQMNQTLEAMAQAIFKEWFVDFNFPGFDGVLVDGLPKGWRMGKVKDVCSVNSNSLGTKDKIDEVHYVEISEVNKGIINNIKVYQRGEEPSRAKRKLTHGDTVLSTVRPNRGSYFIALFPNEKLIASTGFAVFSSISVPFSFLYFFLTGSEQLEFYGKMADGAAYPAINQSVIMEIDLVIPTDEILEAFHSIAGNSLIKCHNNLEESKILTQLRDTLLSKLMSGQIAIQV